MIKPFWRVEKSFTFDAAHFLPQHDGKCRDLHGHTYKVTLAFERDHIWHTGPKVGMVRDFSEIAEEFKALSDAHLDHKLLNESTLLTHPTSEALARWIFARMQEKFPDLVSVTVHETESSSSTYFEQQVAEGFNTAPLATTPDQELVGEAT